MAKQTVFFVNQLRAFTTRQN